MIKYEVYKMLHLVTILLLISSLGFFWEGKIKTMKKKVAIGLISFLIFVAGMGLIARLGFKHTEPFPDWVRIKIAMWVLVNMTLIFIGRVSENARKWAIGFLMGFVLIAVYAAIFKPY